MRSEQFETTYSSNRGVFYISVSETNINYFTGYTDVNIKIEYYSPEAYYAGVQSIGLTDNNGEIIHCDYSLDYGRIDGASHGPVTVGQFVVGVNKAETLLIEFNYQISNQNILTNVFEFSLTPYADGRSISRTQMPLIIDEMAQAIASILPDKGIDAIPWAYYQFPTGELTDTPFLIYFYDGNDDFKADNLNYAKIENLVIEFYIDNVNFDCEAEIERILDKYFINYTKSFSFIEDEEMYLTRYESEILINQD